MANLEVTKKSSWVKWLKISGLAILSLFSLLLLCGFIYETISLKNVKKTIPQMV
ncbi:hypothetical protein ACFFIX_17015 [Metabacillus herbersteinensis]|uniref:Uncharacterized protein n=1 Tax=Metabacillus herbersteinensis TaxID=283816 RepID=A0ABV6GHF9_9BACI